jgi:hypothetical protein
VQIDKDSFFRNRITAWHETPPVCWTVVALSLVIILFALSGSALAIAVPGYRDFLWLPVTLALACLYLMVRAIIRIATHHRAS